MENQATTDPNRRSEDGHSRTTTAAETIVKDTLHAVKTLVRDTLGAIKPEEIKDGSDSICVDKNKGNDSLSSIEVEKKVTNKKPITKNVENDQFAETHFPDLYFNIEPIIEVKTEGEENNIYQDDAIAEPKTETGEDKPSIPWTKLQNDSFIKLERDDEQTELLNKYALITCDTDRTHKISGAEDDLDKPILSTDGINNTEERDEYIVNNASYDQGSRLSLDPCNQPEIQNCIQPPVTPRETTKLPR